MLPPSWIMRLRSEYRALPEFAVQGQEALHARTSHYMQGQIIHAGPTPPARHMVPRRIRRRAPCRALLAVRSAYGWWRRALGALERVPTQRSMHRVQAAADGRTKLHRTSWPQLTAWGECSRDFRHDREGAGVRGTTWRAPTSSTPLKAPHGRVGSPR
jgi:hypothetical protein